MKRRIKGVGPNFKEGVVGIFSPTGICTVSASIKRAAGGRAGGRQSLVSLNVFFTPSWLKR